MSTALAERSATASSAVLLWIAAVGYAVLWAGYLWRVMFRWQDFRPDLAGPRGFAFLTAVAASDVLAARLAVDRHHGGAAALTVVGTTGWLVLGYGVPLLLVSSGRGVSLRQVNGTWFIWVVGTQSVAVATTALAPHTGDRALGILASASWAVGLLQYLLVAALALARLLLEPVEPTELIPPYWVFMGAAAISVLARRETPPSPARGHPAARDVRAGSFGRGVVVLHLADPTPARPGRVAPRAAPRTAALRDEPVEHGLPGRHVRGGRAGNWARRQAGTG